MMNTEKDRRRDVRVTFRSTTILVFSDKVYEDCETINVSVGGAFVKDVNGPDKGDQCKVVFHLDGRTSRLELEMDAEVIRTAQDGIAIQFFNVDTDSFCHLKNIVYYNYKHPEELDEDYVNAVEDETVYRCKSRKINLSGLFDEKDDDFDDFDANDEDMMEDGVFGARIRACRDTDDE